MMKSPVATLLLLVAVSPLAAFGDDPQGRPEEIRIAVYSDVGVGRSVGNLLSVLERADRLHVEKVTAEEVRNGALDGFAVLVHPGGSGSKQGKQLGEEGREAVRSFVRRGGGFLGICAGAYLASADYPWSLHILDAKVLDRKHWARGTGAVRVALTDRGRAILHADSPNVTIYYGQGPLLAPAADADVPDYVLLGAYETEIAKNGAP
ncbi:MAG: biofilm PGA synthesis protein PgaB, partial [Planctomycetes bacterium]|nr:biofilm PGA synthesis protein PgaB [Planctomycetota bacterium]